MFSIAVCGCRTFIDKLFLAITLAIHWASHIIAYGGYHAPQHLWCLFRILELWDIMVDGEPPSIEGGCMVSGNTC